MVTVQFISPTVGITAPAIAYTEDPVTYEKLQIFEAEADGITYHLPEGETVCFEVFPDEEAGYFVSQWLIDGSPIIYSGYMNYLYEEAYEGMTIEAEFENENVFYKVEYEAPYGTMIRCINRDEQFAQIESGAMVLAASNILFMISPDTNPDGEVALKAWYINGIICADGGGTPITNNSIEFKLLEDVKVTAELEDLPATSLPDLNNHKMICTVTGGHLTISNAQGETTLYDLYGKQVMTLIPDNGPLFIPTATLSKGIYVVRDGHSFQKVLVY